RDLPPLLFREKAQLSEFAGELPHRAALPAQRQAHAPLPSARYPVARDRFDSLREAALRAERRRDRSRLRKLLRAGRRRRRQNLRARSDNAEGYASLRVVNTAGSEVANRISHYNIFMGKISRRCLVAGSFGILRGSVKNTDIRIEEITHAY